VSRFVPLDDLRLYSLSVIPDRVRAWIGLRHTREDEQVVLIRKARRKQLPSFLFTRPDFAKNERATRPRCLDFKLPKAVLNYPGHPSPHCSI
jgi:hypothetical protein